MLLSPRSHSFLPLQEGKCPKAPSYLRFLLFSAGYIVPFPSSYLWSASLLHISSCALTQTSPTRQAVWKQDQSRCVHRYIRALGRANVCLVALASRSCLSSRLIKPSISRVTALSPSHPRTPALGPAHSPNHDGICLCWSSLLCPSHYTVRFRMSHHTHAPNFSLIKERK